jgi:FkbM family methyltransferase
MASLRILLSYTPNWFQILLKQLIYTSKIKMGRFVTSEPEFKYIETILRPGDSVIDIGANMGVYTLKFSKLVGATGRVYAFEPIPESFYLLTMHTNLSQHQNITLFNMAASMQSMIVSMIIPRSDNRLRNYYTASIAEKGVVAGEDSIQVYCCPLDTLQIPPRIRLIKIDAEGHEGAVLSGMRTLVERDKPILIVETVSSEIAAWLTSQGYQQKKLPDSPNTIFAIEQK